MAIQEKIKRTALKTAFSYLEKNPEKNVRNLMDLVDALAGEGEKGSQPAGGVPGGD